jgi:hypothetical protein
MGVPVRPKERIWNLASQSGSAEGPRGFSGAMRICAEARTAMDDEGNAAGYLCVLRQAGLNIGSFSNYEGGRT